MIEKSNIKSFMVQLLLQIHLCDEICMQCNIHKIFFSILHLDFIYKYNIYFS